MNTENTGFQQVLEHIRFEADSEARKGRLFERLMRAYFREDPLYRERFSDVWLWPDWARRTGWSGLDTGIDLVAEERGGAIARFSASVTRPARASRRRILIPS